MVKSKICSILLDFYKKKLFSSSFLHVSHFNSNESLHLLFSQFISRSHSDLKFNSVDGNLCLLCKCIVNKLVQLIRQGLG